MKCPLKPMHLGIAIALAVAGTICNPIPATHARPKLISKPISVAAQFTMPPPPPKGRPAGIYRGGASRGDECPPVTVPLTALVPFTSHPDTRGNGYDKTYVGGLTTSAHPTFWFHVPYNGRVSQAEFLLLNAEESEVLYQSQVELPANPGILGVRLPADAPALESGKFYRWFFAVYCGSRRSGIPVVVEGDIQRVSLSPQTVNQQMEMATTPRQRVALYANNGIWYDALTTLADLRLANVQDSSLSTEWTELLRSIGLEDVATVPLVQ